MNIKKLFATLAGVSLFAQTVVPFGALAATYSAELQGAYDWAYSKGVTTMSSIDNANMYGAITRAEMAKMLSVYATEVLGMTPDTSAACTFSDIDSVKGDLHDFIIESCQLGIMGQGITAFRPYDTISRAEFGTALSRVLWGSQYEGGTPYYAKHLEALRSAGIMTQIANAESTKEVRGYVMLMLQRSDENGAGVDCDDPMTVIACAADSSACPAACRESDEPKVVRSGDLAVSAEAAANRKILATGTSDLDTITFRTNEDVTISKITLERYGYSTSDADKITGIWLEDEDGNIIADSKTLTKDKVTLNIKKDYRSVDGEFVATIVVKTNGVAGTIGFKVVDVDSTAKNLNLDNYTPYTYDVVEYVGSTVTVEMKWSNKVYNYEEGESYEIARVKVSAGDAAVLVRWFTLTNAGKVDMWESLDKLVVKADSKEIKAKASVNKDDELVVSFNNDYELDINKKVTFILEATFKDFDDYGQSVEYYVFDEEDFSAVESKNGTRVQLNLDKAKTPTVYRFNGGKIKLTNTKLGNVDAAQASEWTVVAEWNITITEPISKLTFVVTGSSQWAEKLTLVVGDEEYDGSRALADIVKWAWTAARYTCKKDGEADLTNQTSCAAWWTAIETTPASCTAGKYTSAAKCTGAIASAKAVFTFSNVSIDESSKIQFKLDVTDNENAAGSIEFEPKSIGGNVLSGAKYDNVSKQYVNGDDVAGSISFSKVTIQPAKASLKNTVSKAVEFVQGETSRKVVFEGTYTAKKGDIDLNRFIITNKSYPFAGQNKVRFYLYVDGEEVADTDTIGGDGETFSDVRVEAKWSVSIKVEAEVEAYGSTTSNNAVYNVEVMGTDMNGNEDTGRADANMAEMKIKASAWIDVDKTASKNTIELRKADAPLASFNIAPTQGDDSVLVEDIVLAVEKVGDTYKHATGVTVNVDGTDADCVDDTSWASNHKIVCNVNDTIEWKVNVTISLDNQESGEFVTTVTKINTNTTTREWRKNFVWAEVFITKAVASDSKNTTTVFTYEIGEKYDSDYTIKNLAFFSDPAKATKANIGAYYANMNSGAKQTAAGLLKVKSGDIDTNKTTVEIDGITAGVQYIDAVAYQVYLGDVLQETVMIINYDNYDDYLSYNGTQLRVYKMDS